MEGFGLIIEELGSGAVRIALHGELDLAHAYTFDEELRQVEAAPPLVRRARPARADVPGLVRARAAAGRAPARAPRRATGCCWCAGRRPMQRLFALSAVDESFEMVSELPVALTAR